MYKTRLLFEKSGAASYISHLDLMQAIQRSMCRAKLPVRYSEGFNPHIKLSILVPLSTGFGSRCELCDFELLEQMEPNELISRMNKAFPSGIRALAVCGTERSVAAVAWCGYEIVWNEGDAAAANAAFSGPPLLVEKRSKRGTKEIAVQDYVRAIEFEQHADKLICRATLKAGDDPLNPIYITGALQQAGVLSVDAVAEYTRTSVLLSDGSNFVQEAAIEEE
ncbi:MAG: DUF2344 domain-containing protein [Clostridia bacterium]|nr:DUF2344 domain-containing protein [Clostridia bacterium]